KFSRDAESSERSARTSAPLRRLRVAAKREWSSFRRIAQSLQHLLERLPPVLVGGQQLLGIFALGFFRQPHQRRQIERFQDLLVAAIGVEQLFQKAAQPVAGWCRLLAGGDGSRGDLPDPDDAVLAGRSQCLAIRR